MQTVTSALTAAHNVPPLRPRRGEATRQMHKEQSSGYQPAYEYGDGDIVDRVTRIGRKSMLGANDDNKSRKMWIQERASAATGQNAASVVSQLQSS